MPFDCLSEQSVPYTNQWAVTDEDGRQALRQSNPAAMAYDRSAAPHRLYHFTVEVITIIQTCCCLVLLVCFVSLEFVRFDGSVSGVLQSLSSSQRTMCYGVLQLRCHQTA